MFEVTITNSIIFALSYWVLFYIFFSLYWRKLVALQYRRLLYYVSLFSLFGVVGEAFTNTLYGYIFGVPLWEYHLFPAHGGDITFLFFFVWGTLGFYTYLRDACFRGKGKKKKLSSGLILGGEAIFIELLLNVPFFLLFGSYIFYYFPANLGPLSHFSTLHVIPFYMIVGYVTGRLIELQEELGYRGLRTTLSLYWMVIITFVFF
jgi:hypothetical protein